MLIDVGLAFSIAFSVLILMVSLWIHRPLEFSAFPTVLLIATMLRLSLNVATTRLILSNGAEGYDAAGHVIAGFANFVMGGDFVIGTVVFVILITVNFLVITKGATRIAEVGARFTLDAIPGKQMAIDADLSAGNIDEKEAMRRPARARGGKRLLRLDGRCLEVRARRRDRRPHHHGRERVRRHHHRRDAARAWISATAADVFVRLSVGDGIVTQIPALIISLAAGLLVSKGGTRGSAEMAIMAQFGKYPRALSVAATVMFGLALAPGLPFLPFAVLAGGMLFVCDVDPEAHCRAKGGGGCGGGRGGAQDAGRITAIGQGAAQDCGSGDLSRQAVVHSASGFARRTGTPGGAHAAGRSRSSMASWCPRSRSRTTSLSPPRPTRSRSTARSWPAEELRSATCWLSRARARCRMCRSTRGASRPSV